MATRRIPALEASAPISVWLRSLAPLVLHRRSCSSSTEHAHRYTPHRLGSTGQMSTNINHTTSQNISSSMLSHPSSSSSSIQLTPDSFAPPATLTPEIAIEYMASLRGLHHSLGTSSTSSRVRWQAREFLLHGMPHASQKNGFQEPWKVTEELACAVVVTCSKFEVTLFECPYGRESGEFLHTLWTRRLSLSSSLSPTSPLPHNYEEAVVLGQLCLAVLEQVANRLVCATAENHKLLSQLLCEALLPSVMRFLQEDTPFAPRNGGGYGDEGDMTPEQKMAFSLLLSSLTKATVTRWACGRTVSGKGPVVFFGMPAPHLQASDCIQKPFSELHTTMAPLSIVVLARVLQYYARSLSFLDVKKSALPVLRFFTLTQCVPQLVVTPSEDGDLTELTDSLATSLAAVMQVVFDPRVTFVSHRVANIASIYARVLSFCPVEKTGVGHGRDEGTLAAPSWRVFEGIMTRLQHNILHSSGALFPSTVMLQLCERVTPFAKKYLFSDLAALLNALARIYHVVREHHASQQKHRLVADPSVGELSGGAAYAPLCTGNVSSTRSRFERRRNTASVLNHLETTRVIETADADNASSMWQQRQQQEESSSLSSPLSKHSTLVVSTEDMEEIESELEVLLDACVAVMERHMPSFCTSRQVFALQQGSSSLTTSQDNGEDRNTTSVNVKAPVSLARFSRSHAKALGGRSRLLKKSIAGKELMMIAESVHALSWRPFLAFQERLLMVLSSEIGQLELSASQYACLVRLVLRTPPTVSSVVFHAVEDRLKRLIHSEAVTVGTRMGEKKVVIAAALARSLQDHPLSLYDACITLFAFAQKMKGSALPLINDLFVRCGQRVLCDYNSAELSADTVAAFILFVASTSWALSNMLTSTSENRSIDFIKASRDHAIRLLTDATRSSSLPSLPFRELSHTCIMLDSCNAHENAQIAQLRDRLREAYLSHAARFDSLEVAHFVADFFATLLCWGEERSESSGAFLQMPSWMIAPLRLRERCENGRRLLSVMFFPLLRHVEGDVENVSCSGDLARTLEVTRQHCRTFATLVATLRLLHIADAALLADDAVREVVLRKVRQLTRRTARPLDLFLFFEMYGDSHEVVSVALSELVPEARCFSLLTEWNAFVPIVEVNAALRTVRRLRVRVLRQQWLSKMSPLIVRAVSFSREPLDVVVELAELVSSDDPELLQAILKSSSSMNTIDRTFSFTASGNTLLRLLLLLQGGNTSHSTMRSLRMASGKLLRSRKISVPLEQLAQAMLLPSLEGTTLGRRLQRLFIFNVGRLLGTVRQSSSRLAADAVKETRDGESLTTRRKSCNQWDESLNHLELEHWLMLLRFSHVGETSSHRMLMDLKQQTEDALRRRGKPLSDVVQVAQVTSSSNHLGDATLHVVDGDEEGMDVGPTPVDILDGPRYRGLAVVYAFSECTIMCLRHSLGASRFIAFVSELLRSTSRVGPHKSLISHQPPCQTRWMYDGSLSPLSDELIWPFVQLASQLVEDMSVDMAAFLKRECQGHKEKQGQLHEDKLKRNTELIATEKEIVLDIGAILGYLQALEVYNPVQREKDLMGPLSHGNAIRQPQQQLHRILLQVPQHWGVGSTAADGTVHIRLQNISVVFDYCTTPTRSNSLFGLLDTSTEACSRLERIFGADRPLVCNVWMPMSEVETRNIAFEKNDKARLFDALMQCLIRTEESSAATKTRLAVLGQRDLVCVVRACVSDQCYCGGDDNENGSGKLPYSLVETDAIKKMRRRMRVEAVSAIGLLTDMLPSIGAHELHDVVLALIPLLQADRQRMQKQPRALKSSDNDEEEEEGEEAKKDEREVAVVAEVRRLLAHVAVLMANDTERFPLPLLLDILQRLHAPYLLVSPGAAEMMLRNLNATDGETGIHLSKPELKHQKNDGEAGENDGDQLTSDVPGTRTGRGHYAATVALLRSIVATGNPVGTE